MQTTTRVSVLRVSLHFSAIFLSLILGLAQQAWSHARLMAPLPRSNADNNKVGPCGRVAKTANPTVLTAGQQLTVNWEETIDHPGRYILAYSVDNDVTFTTINANLPDTQGGALPHRYTTTITVPNVTCTNCTLRLIQSMEENPAAPTFYYSCADVRIQAVGQPTPTPTATPNPTASPTATPTPSGSATPKPSASPTPGSGNNTNLSSRTGANQASGQKPGMSSGCGLVAMHDSRGGGGGGPTPPWGLLVVLAVPMVLLMNLRRRSVAARY